MEINSNMKWGGINNLPPIQPATSAPAQATDTDGDSDPFANSTALEGALKQSPDTRADVVAKGRALVSDSGYPPGDTVKKLSSFLARKLQESNQ